MTDLSERVSIDSILEWMQKSVEERNPISPDVWLDAATKLTVLLGNLDDELIESKMKYERLDRRRQQVIEYIRVAKKRSELMRSEYGAH